ncbi:DNA starvation/stationary phase protection protein, partial [Coprobacillus cateniformis]|nr:DNA starvation/stationary phase protection protein [Coprobacillus cateniformis]
IDEVAEKILMIGGSPLASMQEFLDHSQIQEAPMAAVSSQDIYQSVLKDFNYLLNSIKNIKKEADNQDNYLISSTMDNYIEEFSKAIWMLNQTIA